MVDGPEVARMVTKLESLQTLMDISIMNSAKLFAHENQIITPSLSLDGQLCPGNKADILDYLELEKRTINKCTYLLYMSK